MAPNLRVVPSEPAKAGRRRAPAKRATAAKKAAPRSRAKKQTGAEETKQPERKSLAEAIASGSQLDILLAQRDEIVASLPGEKGQAKATLHRLLTDITDRIAALEKQAEVAGGKSKVVANTANDAWDQSAI